MPRCTVTIIAFLSSFKCLSSPVKLTVLDSSCIGFFEAEEVSDLHHLVSHLLPSATVPSDHMCVGGHVKPFYGTAGAGATSIERGTCSWP